MSQYNQGKFIPKNPHKYIGNVHEIFYRSSWEKKFMIFLDLHDQIIQWASEELAIPYISPVDNKVHRYFPDFLIKKQTPKGAEFNLIEVKPSKQTQMPVVKKHTRRKLNEVVTYAVNQSKWKAAEEYCRDRGWKFMVITEKELFGK